MNVALLGCKIFVGVKMRSHRIQTRSRQTSTQGPCHTKHWLERHSYQGHSVLCCGDQQQHQGGHPAALTSWFRLLAPRAKRVQLTCFRLHKCSHLSRPFLCGLNRLSCCPAVPRDLPQNGPFSGCSIKQRLGKPFLQLWFGFI